MMRNGRAGGGRRGKKANTSLGRRLFRTRDSIRGGAKPVLPEELDRICREIVMIRDGRKCRKCGRSEEMLRSIGSCLHWCHVYSRRVNATRWDLDNSFAGCVRCHLYWWHKEPVEAKEWWEAEIGPERFAALRLRAKKSKIVRVDLWLMKVALEGELKRVRKSL